MGTTGRHARRQSGVRARVTSKPRPILQEQRARGFHCPALWFYTGPEGPACFYLTATFTMPFVQQHCSPAPALAAESLPRTRRT